MDNSEYYINFCRNFRRLRQERKLNILQVAEATDTNQWELLVIDSCIFPASLDFVAMLKLCEYFNVSLLDMLVSDI